MLAPGVSSQRPCAVYLQLSFLYSERRVVIIDAHDSVSALKWGWGWLTEQWVLCFSCSAEFFLPFPYYLAHYAHPFLCTLLPFGHKPHPVRPHQPPAVFNSLNLASSAGLTGEPRTPVSQQCLWASLSVHMVTIDLLSQLGNLQE